MTLFRRGERSGPEVTVEPLSLEQTKSYGPIPSDYTTDRVLALDERYSDSGMTWILTEHTLVAPFSKTYDDGEVDSWLEPYLDSIPGRAPRFLAALSDDRMVGMATWATHEWNNTVWLVDIRTRSDRRRSGVGSLLMTSLKRAARGEGARGIMVETQINNFPAYTFYRSHGFRVAGFNHHLYENDDLINQDVALFLFWEATSG
jgi:ribosomal protein S18 acetylase RimI-like enzyme